MYGYKNQTHKCVLLKRSKRNGSSVTRACACRFGVGVTSVCGVPKSLWSHICTVRGSHTHLVTSGGYCMVLCWYHCRWSIAINILLNVRESILILLIHSNHVFQPSSLFSTIHILFSVNLYCRFCPFSSLGYSWHSLKSWQ
jgi:hypothetical protein